MLALELPVKSLQGSFFPLFQQLGDQACYRMEPDTMSFTAGGMTQSTCQVSFSRPRIAHQQDVFLAPDVLTSKEFPNCHFIDRGLGREVKCFQRLDNRRNLGKLRPDG